MITQSRDTSPEAERVLIDLLRQAPPWKKWHMTEDMHRSAKALAMIGLRNRHPTASPEELQRRLAALFLGDDVADLVFGPIVPRR